MMNAGNGFAPSGRKEQRMQALWKNLARKFWRDDSGQDMIEYALLSAALVIIVAGFLPPSVMPSISTIFSKISANLNAS